MNPKSRGLGPSSYNLPPTVGFTNHDIRKPRNPQYSFGSRLGINYKTLGPGPASYNIQNVTRYGSDGTPKYSMRPRTTFKENLKSPGPGSNNYHLFKGTTGPAFSLKARHYRKEKTFAPPPNTYNISVQPIKPKAPEYSMGRPLPRKPFVLSPGPATYDLTNLNAKLNKSPAFSLAGRIVYSFKPCGLAPNIYDISYYRPGPTGLKYSFGTKHSDYAPPYIVPHDNLHCGLCSCNDYGMW